MLQMKEDFINATRSVWYGDADWYEPYTQDRGQLYRSLVREYGRCTSKVYVDPPNGGPPQSVGWVFVKRVEYDDAHRLPPGRERTYLRETWITLREMPDEENDA